MQRRGHKILQTLQDPVAAVRLQAAQNLAVIGNSQPEHMWAMAERIAGREANADVLAFFLHSMRCYSHAVSERCETVLAMIMTRWADGLIDNNSGTNELCEVLGSWTAQLFVGQARDRAREWLAQWANGPLRFSNLLTAFVGALPAALFVRYEPAPAAEISAMSGRAQQAIELILSFANGISAEAQAAAASDTLSEDDRQQVVERFQAAESVILHTTNQFYFGSGAFGELRIDDGPGLRDAATIERFLADYSGVLAMLADSRHPEVLHNLIELYAFLIPGDPSAVFRAVHAILVGHGE